ncbi:ABC-F family ATP-binding cassette domain-containing protein [Rhizomicrobium electricum]|uniref:ABC-F family ATP-binding cassette domain-containing protein n=1 Tax=Rhizomicrobium electricum TaxID=480070 RepID=A0ABN1EC42_9PROT|nr:ABC-F family ATP-binding cassette domain-containing protein [Rhizomicrobium electricum]NIJ48201.1 ATP-binding cassette subfamily F protein 3 [Rhizomicrobium electricum]
MTGPPNPPQIRPAMLTIDNVTVRIAGRVILDGASAGVPAGRRVGLVGRNGCGKSTLLKAIQGIIHPDGGETTTPKDWRIGALAQEAPSGPQSLIETVLSADKERTALLARAETEKDPHTIADIHARLHTIDSYSAPARAAEILAGLGFPESQQQRPCSEFSGGWRMRVALAAVLFSAPDLLLLDEPTNYLDLEGVLWLEDYLKRYRGTVLIVSHDRDLLNTCAEFILHLEHGKLTLYTGGYDTFVETRAMKRALDEATAKKVDAQRKHLQAFVDRFRYKASKATQAQSRIKMLERLQTIDIPMDEHVAPIRLPAATEASPPLITMENVSVGYVEGQPILTRINLRFDPDDRIALLGKNGNGKSTLAKLLAGKLEPMGGTLTRAKKMIPGYFAQHQLEELNGDITPIDTLARLRPHLTLLQVRNALGGFGFSADKQLTKVGNLSGGERARLMLALATLDNPNLIILDEPTNHLDIDARGELLSALNDFDGAVILISHDRRLLEATADRLFLVADGRVMPFDGDLDDYRKFLLTSEAPVKAAVAEPKQTKEDARREAAAKRLRLKPLKDKVDAAEHQIETLNAEIKKLDATLADPLLFVHDPRKGTAVSKKRADAVKKLEAAEERWLLAHEDYERAAAE